MNDLFTTKSVPHFTVVTTVFNGADTIEETIKSVICQSYNNIDYIIIDGNSTDSTLAIVKKYERHISFWSSEPDLGIYDGMNKGARKAKADSILYFLNCDDKLHDENVIRGVAQEFISDPQLQMVYGDVQIFDSDHNLSYKTSIKQTGGLIKRVASLNHQGIFVRKSVLEKNNYFDLQYTIAADTDFLYKVLTGDFKTKYINRLIACFRTGGFGSNKSVSKNEVSEIINKNLGYPQYLFYRIRRNSIIAISRLFSWLGIMRYYYKVKAYLRNKR
ncbi:MAG: glycosyltransferase [Candidatus Kerfeldbacteria bacterium CG08_land_8_20_14_0_20_40_16]|uniref:Glycosyltransferase n=1 Tax=Candidatus Kerfeldbacteria bacterium CG08_land_8_20_14_0_20_40_16 TaxID=2014244 RepID=A0A2H0YVN2_9BACT|nr:MAG: glycosyltransferase [Candidatus Kerfeldbacteria bacterium CG08_land_8_20_14_0_20_40_16]